MDLNIDSISLDTMADADFIIQDHPDIQRKWLNLTYTFAEHTREFNLCLLMSNQIPLSIDTFDIYPALFDDDTVTLLYLRLLKDQEWSLLFEHNATRFIRYRLYHSLVYLLRRGLTLTYDYIGVLLNELPPHLYVSFTILRLLQDKLLPYYGVVLTRFPAFALECDWIASVPDVIYKIVGLMRDCSSCTIPIYCDLVNVIVRHNNSLSLDLIQRMHDDYLTATYERKGIILRVIERLHALVDITQHCSFVSSYHT